LTGESVTTKILIHQRARRIYWRAKSEMGKWQVPGRVTNRRIGKHLDGRDWKAQGETLKGIFL
jgi:hypothetical protein